mmetsp:Transcript_27693/g.45028  ORF Transcript_27693/g.45028 Transcript_27693/m.45028 type:complete len:242 (-) Transcript_27693:808-1533(-)
MVVVWVWVPHQHFRCQVLPLWVLLVHMEKMIYPPSRSYRRMGRIRRVCLRGLMSNSHVEKRVVVCLLHRVGNVWLHIYLDHHMMIIMIIHRRRDIIIILHHHRLIIIIIRTMIHRLITVLRRDIIRMMGTMLILIIIIRILLIHVVVEEVGILQDIIIIMVHLFLLLQEDTTMIVTRMISLHLHHLLIIIGSIYMVLHSKIHSVAMVVKVEEEHQPLLDLPHVVPPAHHHPSMPEMTWDPQ